MKPLVLIAYPRDMSFPIGYVLPRDTRITVRAAQRMAHAKRFSDAELAAEYWRSESDENAVTEGYHWQGICGQWPPDETSTIERAMTIRRFAILPHYDEVTK